MKKGYEEFPSADGKTTIHATIWEPDGKPKAVLQIIHGMVEYIGRYENFATYLTEQGFAVCGIDLLGHGRSVTSEDEFGYFGSNGNEVLIEDNHTFRKIMEERFNGLPYFMMGHSMGSFLIRQYIAYGEEENTYSEGLSGVIVMGTGWQPGIALGFGKFLTSLMAKIAGPKHKSAFIDFLAFGANNKKIKPSRTRSDWISKDEEIVNNYVKDPWCSFRFTVNGYYNMFKSIALSQDVTKMQKLPKGLSIIFLSGASDPVGQYGEGVRKAFVKYEENTPCTVDIKLYENDRHEILNEKDKETVYSDINEWLSEVISN